MAEEEEDEDDTDESEDWVDSPIEPAKDTLHDTMTPATPTLLWKFVVEGTQAGKDLLGDRLGFDIYLM